MLGKLAAFLAIHAKLKKLPLKNTVELTFQFERSFCEAADEIPKKAWIAQVLHIAGKSAIVVTTFLLGNTGNTGKKKQVNLGTHTYDGEIKRIIL